jgi:NAD(P)-dependent dehydrogenase (short-subunit alcohol dehydrogenase family)
MMGPYTAAKAGVEALTDALRMESFPSGARVGCAYFGFIDTDLVRAGYALPSAAHMNAKTPAFFSNPAPLSSAVGAIERGSNGARRGSGPRVGSAPRSPCAGSYSRCSKDARSATLTISPRPCAWPSPRPEA